MIPDKDPAFTPAVAYANWSRRFELRLRGPKLPQVERSGSTDASAAIGARVRRCILNAAGTQQTQQFETSPADRRSFYGITIL